MRIITSPACPGCVLGPPTTWMWKRLTASALRGGTTTLMNWSCGFDDWIGRYSAERTKMCSAR